jgi:predicted nucleic acid-binding protein
MIGRVLLDTNVLVYAYDRSEPIKQAQALKVQEELAGRRAGAISVQMLIEFYNAVTRRIAAPLTPDQAYERTKNLVVAWPVLELTPLIGIEAARGASQHQMHIWDAQIWATARLNQIPTILSEDFSDGAVIEGVRMVNPFAARFQLRDWVG